VLFEAVDRSAAHERGEVALAYSVAGVVRAPGGKFDQEETQAPPHPTPPRPAPPRFVEARYLWACARAREVTARRARGRRECWLSTVPSLRRSPRRATHAARRRRARRSRTRTLARWRSACFGTFRRRGSARTRATTLERSRCVARPARDQPRDPPGALDFVRRPSSARARFGSGAGACAGVRQCSGLAPRHSGPPRWRVARRHEAATCSPEP